LKLQYLLFSVLLFGFASANDPIKKTIVTHFTNATVDGNGTVYFVDEKLNLCASKIGTDSIKKFSISNFGSEPIIDAENPLEIFVFFATTGKVVVFDNQLNIQQELNLYKEDNIQPLAFGRANDGNIWILDNNTRTLKKFSKGGELLLESVILKGWSANKFVIGKIWDNGNRIVLCDEEGKIFALNQNVYLEKIVQDGKSVIGLSDDGIFTIKDNHIYLIKEPFSSAVQFDSIRSVVANKKPIAMNLGWLLESNDSALFLQSRN
jgi:hypothetical protein